MSHLPPEYKMFLKKYSASVKKGLGKDLIGLVLYGSLTRETNIPGESDADFALVVKSQTPETFTNLIKTIEKINTEFMNNPLFITLLDLDVYTEDQLKSGDFEKISPIKAYLLKTDGKPLAGTNPFTDLEIPDEELKRDGKRMVMHAYNTYLKEFLDLRWGEYDEENALFEKSIIAMDVIFEMIQGILWYLGEKDFNKNEALDIVHEKYSDKIDYEFLQEAQAIRLGTSVDRKKFLEMVPPFIRTIYSLL